MTRYLITGYCLTNNKRVHWLLDDSKKYAEKACNIMKQSESWAGVKLLKLHHYELSGEETGWLHDWYCPRPVRDIWAKM
jgi:hypothetical protein